MNDTKWMQQTIQLAEQVKGRTFPNPAVGAILVKQGAKIAEGATMPAGGPHAEVVCLNKAGDLAKDGTLYVSLEPCSHFGRTPPCTDAIIQAGIKRVVVAVGDPNPEVNGRGIKKLEQAGIEVKSGVLEREACAVNREFFKFIVQKMPYVTLKYAMTLDGKIACDSGDSRWISGEESRQIVHLMRKRSHAILVGKGTFIADDPELTVRLDGVGEEYQPLRILLTSSGDLPMNRKMLCDGRDTLIVTTDVGADRIGATPSKVEIAVVKDPEFSMKSVFKTLAERQIISLVVEGGASIFTAIIKERLFDEIVAFVAPVLCGGRSFSPVHNIGIDKMSDALRLRGEWQKAGADIYFVGTPQ